MTATINRLRKRADFKRVARLGRRWAGPAFVLLRYVREDGSEDIRIGYTVTKKIGGAVLRNKIKRRLRAVWREKAKQNADPGCDYVVIARRRAETRDFSRLLDDMQRALISLSRKPK